MVMNFFTQNTTPPPVAEIPKKDWGWVFHVGGTADMTQTHCLHAADNAADMTADNQSPGRP
jgi:hypothetical protein